MLRKLLAVSVVASAASVFFMFRAESDHPADGASCVRYRGEARYRNYGYDHVVHLTSTCAKVAVCSVATDAAPEPVGVRLAPAERLEVVTLRGSPARSFVARVACGLETDRFAP